MTTGCLHVSPHFYQCQLERDHPGTHLARYQMWPSSASQVVLPEPLRHNEPETGDDPAEWAYDRTQDIRE